MLAGRYMLPTLQYDGLAVFSQCAERDDQDYELSAMYVRCRIDSFALLRQHKTLFKPLPS